MPKLTIDDPKPKIAAPAVVAVNIPNLPSSPVKTDDALLSQLARLETGLNICNEQFRKMTENWLELTQAVTRQTLILKQLNDKMIDATAEVKKETK